MAINKQLQNVRDAIYEAELGDARQWTRAKVQECLVSAVIVAQRFAPNDPAVAEMLARWPDECSVRFEWFQNLARRPELEVNPQQLPSINSTQNVYLVLTRWLDLVILI